MKNSDEPPAKRSKIEEKENINVEVDVLDKEEKEIEEEEMEQEEEEIVNGFNFNNVGAEECIEFLMDLLHVRDYEQLFHILEEAGGGGGRGIKRRRKKRWWRRRGRRVSKNAIATSKVE